MINQFQKFLNDPPKKFRDFGILFFIVFIAVSLYFWWQEDTSLGLNLASIGVLFGALGLTYPKALQIPYSIWMVLGITIGEIVSRVILTLLYFLLFTPTGLLLKLFGKNLLDLKLESDKKSYWKPYTGKTTQQRYEKPF